MGTIPAYAGKTFSHKLRYPPASELSPRMRGKLPGHRYLYRWSANYPRVCGENEHGGCRRNGSSGTIPAYAGKTINWISPDFIPHRTIPAYAGKTAWATSSSVNIPELSPRMRGKQTSLCQSDGGNWELSPRMRGKTGSRG